MKGISNLEKGYLHNPNSALGSYGLAYLPLMIVKVTIVKKFLDKKASHDIR